MKVFMAGFFIYHSEPDVCKNVSFRTENFEPGFIQHSDFVSQNVCT